MIKANGIPINITKFSDHTSQVWKLPKELFDVKYVTVEWEFESETEIIHLAQLKTLLDHSYNTAQVHLVVPYLPYGRQDKGINNEQTFALNVFADILNNLNFNTVSVMDPHSNVADFSIRNLRKLPIKELVMNVFKETNSDLAVYPDKGARTKYSAQLDLPFIYADKVRNQSTGVIEGLELVGSPKDRNVLIVDDICDGGGTFIGLTEKLLQAGSNSVNLYVTHGIFSKGLRIVKESGISRVFTRHGEAFETQNHITYKEF